MKQPLLFLSHAGEDAAAARELARHLERSDVPVWLDVERLRPGDPWLESLERALRQATAFAVYVGRSGVERWVGQEVRVALDRSVNEPGFTVVPVLGPGSDPEALPVFLRQYQWVDLRGGLDAPGPLRELAEVVLGEDRRGERLRRSLLPPGRAPFLGLRTFAEEDAFLFFGRDREVEELLARLGSEAFLAVVGASGSGKSSLVRAGLLPALRRGRAPGGREGAGAGAASGSPVASWRIALFRPADDPFRELAAALPGLGPELGAAERIEVGARIARELAEPGAGAAAGIERAVAALVPAGTRTLLVADQLEEAFTQTADAELRRRFLDALLAAGRPGGDRPVHILVTLRADFYSRCWEHPELPRRIAANLYPVERMARDQLREVIEKPLALAGVAPETGLVDQLLDDAGDEPGNLPLLEHALFQLWDQPAARRFTHQAYRGMGGLAGALEHHAEAVFAGLDAGGRELTRRLFSRLAVVGEPGTETRRRVPKEDLLATGGAGEEARYRAAALLDRWVERRLLTAVGAGAEAGEERVEVAHEALLRSWDRLGGWLEEDREFLLWRQGLTGAVDAWECADRSEGELLRGGPLARAADWLERRRGDLTPSEADLIAASLAHEQAERRRKLTQARKQALAAVVVAALSLVVAVAVVWFSWRESRLGRLLKARGLAAQVATVAEARPQLGTLLALHALRIAEGAGESRLPEAETALRAALTRLGGRVVGDPAEEVLHGAVTEGAVLLATTGLGEGPAPLRLRRVPLPLPAGWEIAPGEVTTLTEERVSRAALAPSGRWLAAGTENRPARLWWIGGERGEVTEVALYDEEGRPYSVNTRELALENTETGERLTIDGLDERVRTWDLPVQPPGGPLAPAPADPSGPADEDGEPSAGSSCAAALREALGGAVFPESGVSDLPSLRQLRDLAGLHGHDGPWSGCALSLQTRARRLLTWTSQEQARLWELSVPGELTRGPEPGLALEAYIGSDSWADRRVALAPGGGRLALLGSGGSVRLWERGGDAEALEVVCGPDRGFSGLAFTADGGTLVLQVAASGELCALTAGSSEAQRIALAAPIEPESTIAAGPGLAWFVAFDGFGGAQPVDPGCPSGLEPLRGHLSGAIVTAVAAEGRWFASADDAGILYLGEVDEGEPCRSFRHVHPWDHGDRPAVALAVSRGHLAVGRANGEILLWSLATVEAEPRPLIRHDAAVAHLAFSPDGERLASADEAGRILLWDLAREAEPVRIDLSRAVQAVAFTDDGSELRVADASEADTGAQVHAFTLDLDRLRPLACRAAGRNLSGSEAREFLGEEDPPPVCPGLPRGTD